MPNDNDALRLVQQTVSGATRVYGTIQRWKWRGISLLIIAAAGIAWLIAETTDTPQVRIAAAAIAGLGVLVWLARGRK